LKDGRQKKGNRKWDLKLEWELVQWLGLESGIGFGITYFKDSSFNLSSAIQH